MRIQVEGRQPLRGTYRVSGNSNSTIALIAASMLTEVPVTLHNIPDTGSVSEMLRVGESLGMSVTRNDHSLTLNTSRISARGLEREYSGSLGGMLFLAPILARNGHARMTIDNMSSRIQTHLTALRDLGIHCNVTGGVLDLDATAWDTRDVVLMQTSVTATALVCMLAAVMGTQTTIMNAASEPHIVDLLNVLTLMGAQIEGIGSNLLIIRGTKAPSGAEFTVSPDHIEAASIAALAALSGGHLIIEGIRRRDMRLIARTYDRLGLKISVDDTSIMVPVHESFSIAGREEDVDVTIESSPWPGFPSDLIAMATVVASQARGTVLIHEKLFNNRMLFTDKLTAMGAQIVLCDPHRAIVVGPTRLQGEYIDNPDVRTGLAMLGAALCAAGETIIDNAGTFNRNFDHVLDKLVAVGARITWLDRSAL